MKPRQFVWKWLLVGLIALFLVGLAVLPRFIGDSLRLADHVSEALSEWTGGEVKLTGPVRVQYFPDVAIRSGFELTNASRLPSVKSLSAPNARISLNLAELLFGQTRIDAFRLTKPKITLKEAPSLTMGPEQTLQARVANLLDGILLRVLRVRNGTIYMPTAAGTEIIKKIDARFDLHSGTGAMSSFGSFKLRGEAVEFTFDTGALSKTDDSLTAPVTLSFTAPPMAAKLTGVASLNNEFEIDGDLDVEMANARDFLRWAGIALADGENLKSLSASGKAHWNGATLIFEDGSFTLDGNRAIGVLAVTPGPRPRIDGTLAFDRLALDPYIGAGVSAEPASPAVRPSQSILSSVDTDLRISAAEVTAPEIRLGRGGFTINARQGVVASEVGELEFCGGSAAGRVDVDLSQPVTTAKVEGILSDLAIAECVAPGLSIPLSGVGVLKAELSTKGRDYDTLVQELAGPFKIEARTGTVPVDFARFLAEADPAEGDGWGNDEVTAFETLNAECRLGTGHIWCEKVDMQTAHGLISGHGDINLGQQTLDWRFSIAGDVSDSEASQPAADKQPEISIGGALAQPMIRKANQPAANGGATPNNTTATHVQPR
jgi:AsmA protein